MKRRQCRIALTGGSFQIYSLYPQHRIRSVTLRSSYKRKVVLKISQNSLENTRVGVSFSIKLQASGQETPIQVFSFEFCKLFKNTFFKEHLRVTASKHSIIQSIEGTIALNTPFVMFVIPDILLFISSS